MKGVVSGVRDYGNRMGIPTVNGAVYFDPRYLGNPLVYCGNVGLIPRDKLVQTNAARRLDRRHRRPDRPRWHPRRDVQLGGTDQRERDRFRAARCRSAMRSRKKWCSTCCLPRAIGGLFNAVTDCGAGGLSSAVGEMGEEIGAEVWLDKAPLKYEGLSYTEIWISEAQERMVFAVSPTTWDEFHALCESEGVEATMLGRFEPTGRLVLKYHGEVVGDIEMRFLHDGRPPVVREAVYEPQPERPLRRSRSGRRPPAVDALGERRVDADPRLAQCRQQRMDHSPVRSRGARRERDQAAGRRGE